MSDPVHPQDQYLTYDEQSRIIHRLIDLTKTAPLKEKIFFAYAPQISAIPTFLIFFQSWRAGFRGYNLSKYGKARVVTIVSGLAFPANGYLAHSLAHDKLTQPFRRESAWYYGWKHAINHQFGLFSCTMGPLMLTFLFASRLGLLPIPDGMHKPGIRQIAAKVFYFKVKPYVRSIAMTAVASTAIMFFVGMGAYIQSCNLLAKVGRKTISLREENSTQM